MILVFSSGTNETIALILIKNINNESRLINANYFFPVIKHFNVLCD